MTFLKMYMTFLKMNTALGESVNIFVESVNRSKQALSASQPSEGEATAEAQARAYSRNQRSFGSVTQLYNDVVNALLQFPAYAPANDALKVASLQATALNLTQLNDDVAHCHALLKQARTDRNANCFRIVELLRFGR